jgi:hypothetical protein
MINIPNKEKLKLCNFFESREHNLKKYYRNIFIALFFNSEAVSSFLV